MSFVRYHLALTQGRTTISMDKIVSDLMAIKLGEYPDTPEAKKAVRNQLQSFINHDLGRDGWRLSAYVKEKAVLFVSDNMLSEKYWEIAFKRLDEEDAKQLKD